MPGVVLASNRYVKPSGYRVQAAPAGYKPFNGYVNGGRNYGPQLWTALRYQLTFSAAPTNGSTLTIIDYINGVPTSRVYTFTYSGSPGAGIIPLVAGGGTAAQAATAAQVALGTFAASKLNSWTATNPSSGLLRLVSNVTGDNTTTVARSDTTNIALGISTSAPGNVLPAKFGKNFAIMSAGELT